MLQKTKKLSCRENHFNVNNSCKYTKRFSREKLQNVNSYNEGNRVLFARKDLNKINRTQRRILNRIGLNKVGHAPDVPTIETKIGHNKQKITPLLVNAILDSGASLNGLSEKLFNKLNAAKLVSQFNKENSFCISANQTKMKVIGTCVIRLKIKHFSWNVKFSILQNLACDVILGSCFLRDTGLLLDLRKNLCYFNFCPNVKITTGHVKNEVPKIRNVSKAENILDIGCVDMKDPVNKLVKNYPNVFTTKIGKALDFKYDIQLKDNQVVNIRPYPVHPSKMKDMKLILDDLLKQDIIRPSISNYSSPSFLVSKPDKSSRLVINYAKLNEKIVRVNHPIGNMDEFYLYLQNAAYFSVIDLSNSFHQIELTERSKHLTAFSNGVSLFEWNRIPFGMHCGSGILSSYLDKIFRDIKFEYMLNFVDDLLIFSKTKEEHLKHLAEVVDRLSKYNLTVNPNKVKLFHTEVSYLGNIISKNSITIDPSRTESIRNFGTPRNAKDISSFIGMCSYFSKYIKDYAKLAAPLNDLRKKRNKFKWNEECNDSFIKLKSIISNPPVLAIPNFQKPFYLFTDASEVSAGSVIMQCNDEGDKLPIAYYSKKFTDNEKNLSIYHKEALSVVLSIKKFYMYLELQPFYLITDNHALSWVLGHFNKLGKLARWVEQILALPFKVLSVRSKENPVADCLSRLNISKEKIEVVEASENFEIVNLIHSKNCKKSSSVSKKCLKPIMNITADIPVAYIQIAEHQRADNECLKIIESVLNKTCKQNFYIKNKVLMFKKTERSKGKIYVPEGLVDLLFNYYHCSSFGGHPGQNRTVSRVLEHFYRPNLIQLIRERVKNCEICLKCKPVNKKFEGELVSGISKYAMEKLYVDLAGPLVTSKQGNKYILIAVDDFTKYVWLIPIKDATSRTVIDKLQQIIFNNFSTCQKLVSDNGSCFTSVLFKKFMFENSINHYRIIPYSPQSNKSERYLRTVKEQLRIFHHNSQNTWDNSIKHIQTSINCCKNESTGYTSFELMFKHKPNHNLSNLWKLGDIIDQSFSQQQVKDVFKRVIRNCKRSAKRNQAREKYVNNKHPFVVGSKVFVKFQGLSKKVNKYQAKMDVKFVGPYIIRYFISPVSVLLQQVENPLIFKRAHIRQLKLSTAK